jgi:TonB family protein
MLLPGQESADLPDDGPGWLRRGSEAYKSGRLQSAAEAFQKAVELNPGDRTGHLYLASTWLDQYVPGSDSAKNLELVTRAEIEFLRVLDIDPENKTAILSLGSLSFQQAEVMPDSPEKARKLESARAWYEKLVRLDPEQKDAYYWLGVIAWSNWYPKWMNARSQCGLKSGEAGPITDSTIRRQLKDQYGSTIENAVFNFEKALEIDPKYEDALGYMNLLVRTRADLRDTKQEYLRDLGTADQWIQKQRENSTRPGLTAAVLKPAGAPEGPLPGALPQFIPIQSVVLVRKVDPSYPPLAREAGIQGTVRVRAFIGKDGHVRSVQLVSGHPLLVPAAKEAVLQWQYMPTLLNGSPVEVVTDFGIIFELPLR